MKKYMAVLVAMAAIGAFSTNSFAAAPTIDRVSVNVGYNLAGSSGLTLSGNYASEDNPEVLTASGGGGLVISSQVQIGITNDFKVRTSATFDNMNKTFINGNSLERVYDYDKVDGSYIIEKIPEDYWKELDVNKWSVSSDLICGYNLVKSNPKLKAGVIAGANFVYTNAYDMRVETSYDQDDLLDYKYDVDYDYEDNYDWDYQVNGMGIVAGGFVRYFVNNDFSLNFDGYIGLLNFGDLVNGFSNFKLMANASYEICDDVNVDATFTFANAKFNKCTVYEVFDDYMNHRYITYTYKQLIPSIGVIYNF